MADLRIVDAPEIPTNNITGEEKIPTGGNGNYSISLDSLADYTKTKKDLADNTTVDTKVSGVRQQLNAHTQNLSNPHQVTKGQIGLGNVDNTADADKPVSNSTQSAIISAVTPKADKTYVDNVLSNKSDKAYVDSQLSLKSNKVDVYTKAETYTKQESSDLVSNTIATALNPVNTSLELAKRGVINRYDSSLTYNSGERVVLTNGDIVKSTITGNTNDPNVNMTGWLNTGNAGEVESIADLIYIQNPKNGSRVYVKSLKANYTYYADTNQPENGVTVVGKWEMQIQEAYYASWFALPELGDMSEQIKAGYEYATSKKRTFIIDANFNVRSNQAIQGSPLFSAVNVLSNSHLYFLPQGKLTLITDNEDNSNIICAKDVDNYIITSPKLVGDRLTNASTTGTREWGYGLTIYPSSNGYIFKPDIKNCMGDGLYIGKSWEYVTDNVPTNITVVRPKIDRVRRNGISLTSGKNVFVDSPIVSNVTTIDGIAPTEPASGLDIEPESAPDYPIARLENCTIHNPTFINCDKAINFWNQPVGSFMDVRITGETNIYNDSTLHTGLWMRNERACVVGSRLHIDKVVFNSKLDQPVLAFIYETSNVDVVIGEMVNNCNQNLDFVYAPVDGAQVFGKFKVGKLSTTNRNFGFTVVYNSLNSGCTTGLRIENVDCSLGAFNLNSTTKMNKTSRYFVNDVAVINSSKNTNEILASTLQFESYGVTTPTLNMSGDSSKVKITLSPTSPAANPLIIQDLQVPYEGSSYTKLKLQHGAYAVLQRETGETKVAELVGQFEFLV